MPSKRKPRTNALFEALRMVWEGDDIPALKGQLSRIRASDAVAVPAGHRCSIATYVLHADLWNRIWLARLNGEPRKSLMNDWKNDWREPSQDEWPAIRDSTLSNFKRAMKMASKTPIKHKMKSDASAEAMLLNIAIHTAYHVGQIATLKHALRKKVEA